MSNLPGVANRTLILVVICAFLMRLLTRLYIGEEFFWANGYTFFYELAQNLATGKGISHPNFPVAFRVPLYPIFLAPFTFSDRPFLLIVAAQSAVGAGTVLCAGLIARELYGNPGALIAAALAAIYPYYVIHDTALQETSLYAFVMALAVLLLLRVRRSGSLLLCMIAGLALGGAVLIRANLAPFVFLTPLWLLVGGPNAVPVRRRLCLAVVCACVVMATLAPWLTRVYGLTGSVTLTTEAGFFLWLGNNPYTFSRYPQESIDRSQDVAVAALSSQDKSELQARQHNAALVDSWFLEKGLQYIRAHPWHSLGGSAIKVLDAFGWLPSPRRSFFPSLVYALSYGPIMFLGLWGMWSDRRRWHEHSIFYAQFIAFIAVTAVFFGHTSYRSYLDVYLIVFAAGVLARWSMAQVWWQRTQAEIRRSCLQDGLNCPKRNAAN